MHIWHFPSVEGQHSLSNVITVDEKKLLPFINTPYILPLKMHFCIRFTTLHEISLISAHQHQFQYRKLI